MGNSDTPTVRPACVSPWDASVAGHVATANAVSVNQNEDEPTTITYQVIGRDCAVVELPETGIAQVVAKDAFWRVNTVFVTSATITDAANGTVQFTIPPLEDAGILYAQLEVYVPATGARNIYPFHIEVRPNLRYRSMGPPTIFEIRMQLRDVCPEQNFLLDEVEFSDEEIIYAFQRPIDYWNETPPCVRIYTIMTFPFRYHWSIGTIAQLLRMAAHWYRRVDVNISIAGGSIRDKNKWAQYDQLAELRWKEYIDFCRWKKAEMNIDSGWTSINSPLDTVR